MSDTGSNTTGNRRQPGALRALINRAKLAMRLLSDERVPLWTKGLIPLSILYLLIPIDLLPEAFLIALGPLGIIGAADDVAVILILLNVFINLSPPDVVAEYERELSAEGGWQVVDDEERQPEQQATDDEPPEMVEGFYRIVDEDQS